MSAAKNVSAHLKKLEKEEKVCKCFPLLFQTSRNGERMSSNVIITVKVFGTS